VQIAGQVLTAEDPIIGEAARVIDAIKQAHHPH
jgi:hypothetical protein